MARPLSIQARSLLAAGLILAAFLGLAFVALDRGFEQASEAALRERLQGYLYAYLAGSDMTRAGVLIPPEVGPDPRFDEPGASGLYAAILGERVLGAGDGTGWRSPSAVGRELPFGQELPRGTAEFRGVAAALGRLYLLSQGVDWTGDEGESRHFTFHVAEDDRWVRQQVAVYRQTLLGWLGGLGVLLLLLLLGVLRWSLDPLRKVAADLARVERGEAGHLGRDYPIELAGLTDGLNRFIDAEREHVTRQRNTLSDLAHSLKTPLAVMRSQLESGDGAAEPGADLREQVTRMDAIIAYQLSRAATTGHHTFAAPLSIEAPAEEIVRSLEKIHAAHGVLCEFDLDAQARFCGDRGDLMELLGNLLENAFKWSRHRVMLRARALADGSRRPGLELVVEDDGPGIPAEQVGHLFQRGVRGDERVQGHGIGLAIVDDVLKAYHGELAVDRSPELGGARITVRFAPR